MVSKCNTPYMVFGGVGGGFGGSGVVGDLGIWGFGRWGFRAHDVLTQTLNPKP